MRLRVVVTIGELTQPLGETTRYFTTDKNQEINTMQNTDIQLLLYFFSLIYNLLIIKDIQDSASDFKSCDSNSFILASRA